MKKFIKISSIIMAVALCSASFLMGCGDKNSETVSNHQPDSSAVQYVDISVGSKAWFEKNIVDKMWFESYDDTQPAGDADTFGFDADGTGEVWFTVGDGGAAVMYFEYEYREDGSIILKEDENESESLSREKLDDKWKNITVSLTQWEGTDVNILTVTLNDGSTVKYYSECAEILEDGSIKYADGTIVKP